VSESTALDRICQETEVGGSEFDHVEVPGFHERFPNLADVLFSKQHRGSPREPGKLVMFVDDARVKVCITCPTENVKAFVTIASPQTLCEELEDGLLKGTFDWRPDNPAKKGKKSPF